MSSTPTSFGRYQIVRKLGEGGMASVYEAISPFGVPVVLKVVHPEFARVPEVAERFRREGRIQYTLRHPNIVRVTDIVEENNVPALVIDFLDGEDLEMALGRRSRFTIAEVISIGVKLLDALDTAHKHGFIHRDLKPSNIFLETQDHGYEPRLMDFGIAKITEAAAITREQSFTGTPAYASPEQVASTRDVDSRSDLFSMGIVLWELLSGKQPWQEYMDDPYRVLSAVVKEELPALPPDVPPGIAMVVARAMIKDPDARWQTAAAFRDALQECAEENPALSRSIIGPGKGVVPGRLPDLRMDLLDAASGNLSSVPSSADLAEQARLVRTQLAAAQREKAKNEKREPRADSSPRYSSGHTVVSPDSHDDGPSNSAEANAGPQLVAMEPSLLAISLVAADTSDSRVAGRHGGSSPMHPADVLQEEQRRRMATMLPDSALPAGDPNQEEGPRFVPTKARFVGDEPDDEELDEDGEKPKKPEPVEHEDNAIDHAIEFLRSHGLRFSVVLVILGLLFVVWDMFIRGVPLPNDFVIVEPGQFAMGSPLDEPGHQASETSHRVNITHRFAIQNHEVTREDYRIYNLRPPADFEDCGAHCPAVNVTWWDAVEYANARSNQDELEECYVITGEGPNKRATWPTGFECEGYRLPTEAEWEYAARAGESRSVWGGFVTELGRTPVDPLLAQVAIYGANSAVEYPNAEQCSAWSPVGTYCGPSVASQRPANPWGLSDMLGNAAEWVWDFHAPLPAEPQTDPTGPAEGTDHVVRGCSYRDTGSRCRLAARQGVPTVGMRSVGFRLVRSVH